MEEFLKQEDPNIEEIRKKILSDTRETAKPNEFDIQSKVAQ